MRSLACVCVAAMLAPPAHARDAIGIDAGRRVYLAHCAACHGARGEGQPEWERPDAAGEMPAPPHDARGHTWKHADAMLYRIVKDGWRDPYNKTQRLTMPAFGQTLTPREMHDVIQYLKTLWTPEQRRFQREESRRPPFPPEARASAPPQPKQ